MRNPSNKGNEYKIMKYYYNFFLNTFGKPKKCAAFNNRKFINLTRMPPKRQRQEDAPIPGYGNMLNLRRAMQARAALIAARRRAEAEIAEIDRAIAEFGEGFFDIDFEREDRRRNQRPGNR
jgi:DNA-binding FadR family transcriptional regulator